MNNLIILGSGAWARELLAELQIKEEYRKQQLAVREDWHPLLIRDSYTYYFANDNETEYGSEIKNIKVIGNIESIQKILKYNISVICGIGTPKIKKQFVERANNSKLLFHPPIISKDATAYDKNIPIGEGTFICAGSRLTIDYKIGKHVGINLNCTIGHDTIIEDYVQLNPGCNISGNIIIKEGAELGTNVSVIPGVTIGEYCIVGAGAVVTKSLPPYTVCVGMPAKPIKDIPHA